MIPLCCFKSKKAQAVVCLGAALGGFFTALSCFGLYVQYTGYADSEEVSAIDSYSWGNDYCGYYDTCSSYETGTTVEEFLRLMATIFLVSGFYSFY
jgi:hypothetical protein